MIEQAILALCINVQTSEYSKYYSSCTQALMAASMQTHIKQDFEAIQHNYEHWIEQNTSHTTWVVAGIVYTFEQKGVFSYNIPAKPLADNFTFSLNKTQEFGNLTWSF